jgi:lipopolysaccharide/colanic/teichoic acid biosynthesis glycosyltransferase
VYRSLIKPLADRLIAATALIALTPVMAALWLSIRIQMGSPVVFRQTRIGFNDARFEFLKFRSMTDERDSRGQLLPDDQRLTAFGRFLRSTSLDELPQLVNVLRGDMSLIGPRPLLTQYLPRYSPIQRRRHEVRPGITGWSQVNGRNDIPWEKKFELDVWYVDHAGPLLDLKILWITVVKVFGRHGISSTGHATMPEFMGSESLPGEHRKPEQAEI